VCIFIGHFPFSIFHFPFSIFSAFTKHDKSTDLDGAWMIPKNEQ